jgi:putative thiamine transport system permease protein
MTLIERMLAGLLGLTVAGLIYESSHSGLDLLWSGLNHLIDAPAIVSSVWLALAVSLAATWLSLVCAQALTRYLVAKPSAGVVLPFVLAIPHAALALGILLFLDAGGIAMRWALAIGVIDAPLDYLFPRDPSGIGSLLVLVIKETAFFTLIALPIARRLPRQQIQTIGQQAGLSSQQAWQALVWPQIVMTLRPAILIVVVYGLTNLEVAMVVGPDQPQFVAVRLARFLTDPDPGIRAAGAIGLLGLLAVTAGLWVLIGRLARRPSAWVFPRIPVPWSMGGICTLLVLAGIALVLWSFALRYPMTGAWPVWGLPSAFQLERVVELAITTAWLGGLVAIGSVATAIAVLEWQMLRRQPRVHWIWWALLWLPQLPLAAGLLYLLIAFGGAPGFLAVLAGHWLITTPYALIALSEVWFDRDRRYEMVLNQLGVGPVMALFKIWIPRHLGSIAVALAIAFSVSVALYTHTWLLGGGRVETLALELVAYAQTDRRAAAVSGLIVMALPLIAFALALAMASHIGARRLGMRGGGFAQVR